MASITKNSSGNWKAIIRKKGWPSTSKTFSTKKDAQDWSRRVEDEMVRGVYIDRAPSERLTVRSALTRYLAEISPHKSSGSEAREKSTSKPLIQMLGDYSLAAITPQILSNYRDTRLNAINRFGRKMSANQVRLELALLSHLYTVAMQEWGVGLMFNPVMNIRKPRLSSGRERRLSPIEEGRLLAECKKHSNPMLFWIVKLALETAMRRGEITHLRRSQIDLQKRVVRLGSADTKTNNARVVPLSSQAADILRLAMYKHIRILDSDYLFWGKGRDSNGSRKPYDFTDAWEAAREKAGLEDLKFHDLRHEAISRFVEGGLEDQETAAISGHKTMQMLKRYTHLKSEHLVERLDQISAKRTSKQSHT